ncbi:MAG: putative DNA-binding transcriptional regulator YafY, partial [Akkermansiaceae bacterium]
MNRIDRLTAMILMLQSHRVVTAEQIAGHFELSVRTVYRDLSALGEAGVPIVAEAGVGYSLMPGYHMPPVMFSEEEAAALLMSGE